MADGTIEGRVLGLEGRTSRLEQDAARDGQRLRELDRRVDALTPLTTSVVTLTIEFENLRRTLDEFIKRVDKRDQDRDEQEEEKERGRVVSRRWVIGLVVMLICALIGAGALLLVSAH